MTLSVGDYLKIWALNHMDISHRTRVDGSVVVARADIPMDKPKSKKVTEFVINA